MKPATITYTNDRTLPADLIPYGSWHVKAW